MDREVLGGGEGEVIDMDEGKLLLKVKVPEPFSDACIWMQRGVYIQCEVCDRGEKREYGRRVYLDDIQLGEALFQLLSDLLEPEKLPVWERGKLIPGYRESEEEMKAK